jgi:hypothetical protein
MSTLSLLYYSGYGTLSSIDKKSKVTICYPNKEISTSINRDFLKFYTKNKNSKLSNLAYNILDIFEKGVNGDNKNDLQGMLHQFYAFLTYNHMKEEGSYQGLMYMALELVGCNIHTEDHTSKGRIDMVINLDNMVYVIEFKLNKVEKKNLMRVLQ